MQFVPLPLLPLFRPTVYQLSLLQIISYSLTADFEKYCVALSRNEQTSSQKDDKKSQNAQTNISLASQDEIILGKTDGKQVEAGEKNRKKSDSLEIQNEDEDKVEKSVIKKRQSYQRARCQITQVFGSSEESSVEQEKSDNEEREQQITYKDRIEGKNLQVKEKLITKQKKIRKARKIQKVQQKVQQEPIFQISTTVSLIDTIDHPKISIDRFEIQRKKQNLLARALLYEELEQRKHGYQIRERRELKKLN